MTNHGSLPELAAATQRTTLEVPRLPIQILHVSARATRDSPTPPYLGTTLRGALGQALHKLSCTTGQPTCAGCPRFTACGYGVLWEGAGAGDLGELARGADAPRPYVLSWDRPAQRPDRLKRGDALRFRVTLLGHTEPWLAFVILAIRDALAKGLGGARAPFTLERVVVAGPDDKVDSPTGRAIPIWEDGQLVSWHALPSQTLWSLAQSQAERLGGERVTLRFETPLSVTVDNRRMDVPSLPLLVQRLAERIERLRRAWSFEAPAVATSLDWQALVQLAANVPVLAIDTRVQHFERHSRRADEPVPMSGLVGRMELGHLPPPLARLLATGASVHVGKQATFGFGRLALSSRA